MFDPFLDGESIADIAERTGRKVRDALREVIRHNLQVCWVYDGHDYWLNQLKAADRLTVDKNSIIIRALAHDILKKLMLHDPAEVELEITDSKGHKSLVTTSISSANLYVKAGLFPSPQPKEQSTTDIEIRERETLHILIAALVKGAKIDISKPSKAANQIEKLTQLIGARVAPRTIEEHLKRVAKTLGKRATP